MGIVAVGSEKSLEMCGGDGYTATYVYLMPLK